MGTSADSVFVNCPFDAQFAPLFEVLVFSIVACGFVPRCSLEEADSGDVRIDKIFRIIAACRYGIHDISRVTLDPVANLPRFNMPLELGIDLGCKKSKARDFGKKRLLVLDSLPYRFAQCISDIAGQDIKAHGDNPDQLATIVRNWLRTCSGRKSLPGPALIRTEFVSFSAELPKICAQGGLDRAALEFVDYRAAAEAWVKKRLR